MLARAHLQVRPIVSVLSTLMALMLVSPTAAVAQGNTDPTYQALRSVGLSGEGVGVKDLILVRDAARFDVILTTNMFGDILSDEASELSGSLGLGSSVNVGATHCMAQAQHGSAPDIAGQNKANPTSLILSVAMLLDWMARTRGNETFARGASLVEKSVDALLEVPERRTADLGGQLGTEAFTAALCEEITRRV